MKWSIAIAILAGFVLAMFVAFGGRLTGSHSGVSPPVSSTNR